MSLWKEPYHIVIEIENKKCRILKTLKTLGVSQFRYMDIRGFKGGSIRHLVKLPSEQIDKIKKRLDNIEVSKFEGKTSIWFESVGCDVCNTILSHGSFLISGTSVKELSFIYSFISPNYDAFKSIISALEKHQFKPKILEIEKYETKRKTLTEKQERVLWLALNSGFFDYPRKIDTVELSGKLGISPSTLSEIVRRAIRRLSKDYFES